MEQNFQEQTSRFDSYLLRRILGSHSQGTCIACLAHKDVPLSEADVAGLVSAAHELNATVRLYYYIPQSLSHYGKVDTLVTAGAMEDFVDYVHELEESDAKAFYAETHHALSIKDEEIILVHELKAWEKELQRLQKNFSEIRLMEPVST